jgi:hypothetical protein
MEWAGKVARMREKRNKCVSGGKARRKYNREDNIKMDLREIGWSGMNWICLA